MTSNHHNHYVITAVEHVALKYTDIGGGPLSLSVRVEDMGPTGAGDAKVNDDDIVLFYKLCMSQAVAESL